MREEKREEGSQTLETKHASPFYTSIANELCLI